MIGWPSTTWMQSQRDTNKQTWTLKGRCKWSVWAFSCGVQVLFSSSCFPLFFPKSSIKQMTVWLIGGHFRLATRRRTAGTTRTALIKWWKTWRTCCQTSLSYRLPQRRKSYPHLVHWHTHPHSPIPLLYAISQFAPDCPHRSCCSPSVISDVVIEKGSKSPKTKQGAAAKRVNLQKDVSLAAPNPRAPVTRAPGPRRGPAGNARGPPPGPGRGRGRGGPPRQ